MSPAAPLVITERLHRALWEGLTGVPIDTGRLPRLRFPELPGDPLGSAIGADLGTQHWTALLESLGTGTSRTLLDFGCGASTTSRFAEGLGYRWHGLDIPDSQEAIARRDRNDVTFYDGLQIPFPRASFDVVLSVQVFEHVADPDVTIAEISRILKPGARLIGSTSHIEPFHSHSTFTYSPDVFARLLDRHGLALQVISAGIDGHTLLSRRLVRQFGGTAETGSYARFFDKDSPLNRVIDSYGTTQGVDARKINSLKLELCGQFHFLAQRT